MKSSISPSGRGGAHHLVDISRCFCGAKLGWDVGKEAANTEVRSTSPLRDSPVASSRENPCDRYKKLLENIQTPNEVKSHQNITHIVIGKRGDMPPININMITFQASTES